MAREALGLIETKGLIAAIEATDAASKAAAVTVTTAEVTDAALLTIRIEGELGAVQAAVEAGARAAERIGELVAAWIIPRPDEGLGQILLNRRYVSKYHPDDKRPSLKSDQTTTKRPTDKSPSAGKTAQPAAPIRPAHVERPKNTPSGTTRIITPSVSPPKPVAGPRGADSEASAKVTAWSQLEDMPVVMLRQFARTVEGLPLKGRQISMANKEQLLDALRRVITLD